MTNKKFENKVLIYSAYSENNMDFCIEKDKSLDLYCKDKRYKIVKIMRKSLPYSTFETIESFVNIVKLRKNWEIDIDKVVVYDLREIADSNSGLLTLLTILKNQGIELESVMQGRLNFNPLDPEDILSDDYTYNNYQCSKNKKYFVKDESPF